MVLEGGLLRRPMREGPSVEPTVSWAYRRGKGGGSRCAWGSLGVAVGFPMQRVCWRRSQVPGGPCRIDLIFLVCTVRPVETCCVTVSLTSEGGSDPSRPWRCGSLCLRCPFPAGGVLAQL